MPRTVEIDALFERGAEEAQRHVAIVASGLTVRDRLLLESEQQTEPRADRLHPDWQAGQSERLTHARVQQVLQAVEVRPEYRLSDFVEECVRGEDRDQVRVEGS